MLFGIECRSGEAEAVLKATTEREYAFAVRWLPSLGKYRYHYPLELTSKGLADIGSYRSHYWAARLAMSPSLSKTEKEYQFLRGRQSGKSSMRYIDQEGGWPEVPVDEKVCIDYANDMALEDIPRALAELNLEENTSITAHLCATYVGDREKKWWQVRGHMDLNFNYSLLEKTRKILLQRLSAG